MSSPFRLFRRHQKVLMVVLVGLSMLSFVVCGAITDPTNIPPPILVALLAVAVGAIAWLAGLNSKKSSEYGGYGLLIGACLGIVLAWSFGPQPAISMRGGNISHEQLSRLQQQRQIANRFMAQVIAACFPDPSEQNRRMIYFGDASPMAIAQAEVFLREADRLGVTGSRRAVTEFLKQATDQRMSGQLMREICRDIEVSEQVVYDALEREWRIRQVFLLMSGGDILPPESFWDAHQKLKVQQQMEVAVLPAAAFIDTSWEPTSLELQRYFDEYRENFPHQTPEGRPAEGRPGFRQPRRAQFAYVEGIRDAFLDQVDVSEEEIEQEYLRRYPPSVNQGTSPDLNPFSTDFPSSVPEGGPVIPNPFLDGPGLPLPPTDPAPVPSDEDMPAEPESSDTPDPGTAPSEPTPDAPGEPGESATPGESAASESEPAPTPDASPGNSTSVEETTDETGCDDPADDLPAESTEPAEAPPSDAPAESATEENPETGEPAEPSTATDPAAPEESITPESTPETPAEQTTGEMEAAPPVVLPDEVPPPPPLPGEPGETDVTGPPVPSGPPPLTDELRAEIRDYLMQIKADALLTEQMQSFTLAFQNRVGRGAVAEPNNPEHLDTAAAIERAQELAEEFGLYFVQTPLLSDRELFHSEDFEIGRALETRLGTTGNNVTTVMFSSFGDVYRPVLSESPTERAAPGRPALPPESRYVIWKIADIPDYVPETIEDNRAGMEVTILDQVLEAWRLTRARELVEQRAEELLELARADERPLPELFADTPLIEGTATTIDTSETGFMTWYRTPSSAASFMGTAPPVRSEFPGMSDIPLGDSLLETVYRRMAVGEVATVWNGEHTHLFLVRVKNRIPNTPEEWEASRQAFLGDSTSAFQMMQFNFPTPLMQLTESQRRDYFAAGINLFETYEVVINVGNF